MRHTELGRGKGWTVMRSQQRPQSILGLMRRSRAETVVLPWGKKEKPWQPCIHHSLLSGRVWTWVRQHPLTQGNVCVESQVWVMGYQLFQELGKGAVEAHLSIHYTCICIASSKYYVVTCALLSNHLFDSSLQIGEKRWAQIVCLGSPNFMTPPWYFVSLTKENPVAMIERRSGAACISVNEIHILEEERWEFINQLCASHCAG